MSTLQEENSYRLAFPPKKKPHISIGAAFDTTCAYHVHETYQAKKVFVIVSVSIARTSENLTKLVAALETKNVEIAGIRRGIMAHTPWQDVLDISHEVKISQADIIVTLGAGSLTDGAKLVSYVLANNISSSEGLETLSMQATSPLKHPRPCFIQIINIPTSLSGGEYSPYAGATDGRTGHKHRFHHESLGADLIILDPALSITTPERIWLSTGIRAVDHCVECICSIESTNATDNNAENALRLLIQGMLATKDNWIDCEARMMCMRGVVEVMNALSTNIALGASHGIGIQLGPIGVGHGETSCIMLPAVMDFNSRHGSNEVRRKQAKISDILWTEPQAVRLFEARGVQRDASVGDLLDTIIRSLGMPRNLREFGIERARLQALAEACLSVPWCNSNPVSLVKTEQILEILESVL